MFGSSKKILLAAAPIGAAHSAWVWPEATASPEWVTADLALTRLVIPA
jgi:hypothetical protein